MSLTGTVPLHTVAEMPFITLIQLIVAGLTFPAYFALRRAGGPILITQIGYVAAGIGLGLGILLPGEAYALATWMGARSSPSVSHLPIVRRCKRRSVRSPAPDA